jgi:nitroreductase
MTDARDAVQPLLRVRQVRHFDLDRPVDPEALDAIADVARWSGSSQNTQPWRFIVLHDREVIGRIAAAGMPQTRSLRTAPAAIALAMPVQPKRAVSLAYDEGRAAERILEAANLVGLRAGIAWLLGDVRPAVGAMLGLPEGWAVRTVVAIGHGTAAAGARGKPAGSARLPRSETVFTGRWGS